MFYVPRKNAVRKKVGGGKLLIENDFLAFVLPIR